MDKDTPGNEPDNRTPRQREIDEVAERISAMVTPRIDATAEDIAALRAQIRENIESIEARLLAARQFDVQEDRQKPISIAKLFHAIRAQYKGDARAWDKAGYEREVIEQHRDQRSSMSSSQDSLGGYWVPENYMPQEFIEYLRGATPLTELGVRRMTGMTGSPIIIPRQTGGATYYWVAEGASISSSVLSAGELNMEPHDVAGLVKINNRLNLLSNPGAEMIVREDLADVLAEAEFKAVIGQETAPAAPVGVKLWPGVNTTTAASLNIANANAMVYKVEVANSRMRSCAWLMHPAVWTGRASRYYTKHTEDRQPVARGAGGTIPLDLVGYPVHKSTLVDRTASSTATVYFCDWSDVLVPEWMGIEFAVSTEAGNAFERNQTWIRAILTMDVGIRHAGSMCYNASVTDGNGL